MQLPFVKKKDNTKNFFLALLVKPYSVGCILFEEVNKNLVIISSSEEPSEKKTDEFSSEELIQATDAVVSRVEESLPKDATVEKTIFAVPFSWAQQGKILKEHLLKLKKVCDSLALVPLGFMVSVEAVIAYLQKKNGAPVTAIFIETVKDEVVIYLARMNNIVEVKTDKIHENLIKTTEKLLQEAEQFEVLPSKIILLANGESEALQQKFLSHRWTTHLPFLHEPQVVSLEAGFENEAIIHGVAAQMGFEILEAGESVSEDTASSDVGKAEKQEEQEAEEQPFETHDFGFVKEKDITEVSEEKEETVEEKEVKSEKVENPVHEEKENEEPESAEPVKVHYAGERISLFEKLKSLLNILPLGKFPPPSTNHLKIFRKRLVIFPLLLILLFAAFLYLYYFMILSARITIFADQQVIKNDTVITLSTSAPTSASVLHIDTLSEEINGSKTADTTGKRDTGELAKGEVTIFNKTEQKKTFTKGTILVGTNDLEFKLVDDVTVASTSAFSTSFSSSKIKVEAAKFGQEYNLPSNTNFALKEVSTSSFFAKNEGAFSGGTKKTVQVVSKKDMDNLISAITDELSQRAVASVRGKLQDKEVIVQKALSSEFKEKEFDRKENDEAKNITLNAKIAFSFGKYRNSDLEDLVKAVTKTTVSDEYSFDARKSKIELTDIDFAKDKITAKLKSEAIYKPDIDTEKIEAAISGKSVSQADKAVRKEKGVMDVTIIFSRKLPILPVLLPPNKKNIVVDLRT